MSLEMATGGNVREPCPLPLLRPLWRCFPRTEIADGGRFRRICGLDGANQTEYDSGGRRRRQVA